MALSERLTNGANRRSTGLPCSIQELIDSLDPDEVAALRTMLYELGWSQERIYAELKAEGHIVGKQTINRHRSQACRCFL